ncbi:hypothetical protein V2H45_03980 [Tumidithrix elongata RA019]|uniref:Uncharacterized protein n=1 Tax=Tumidithrix elongata BACA0141 TaxID=2716417 RepID=A0AAW9PR08_9CYAN|nr:hypothetical protein [Tumidithrix elongata RA019]
MAESTHEEPKTETTTRKPILLLRLSASFLLRLAERQLLEVLFQEPPRSWLELNPTQCALRTKTQKQGLGFLA